RLVATSPTPNTPIRRKNFFAVFAARKNPLRLSGEPQVPTPLGAQPRNVGPTPTPCSGAEFATLVLGSEPSWASRVTRTIAACPSVSPVVAPKNSSSATPNSSKLELCVAVVSATTRRLRFAQIGFSARSLYCQPLIPTLRLRPPAA